MTRPDYCPLWNEPCQKGCEPKCGTVNAWEKLRRENAEPATATATPAPLPHGPGKPNHAHGQSLSAPSPATSVRLPVNDGMALRISVVPPIAKSHIVGAVTVSLEFTR